MMANANRVFHRLGTDVASHAFSARREESTDLELERRRISAKTISPIDIFNRTNLCRRLRQAEANGIFISLAGWYGWGRTATAPQWIPTFLENGRPARK